MTTRFRRAVAASLFSLTLFGAALSGAPADRTFTTSPEFAREISTLVRLLEEAHYNRGSVDPEDYPEVIPNYMTDLDGQRLFFLLSDREKFMKDYGGGLYWNVLTLGNVDAAFDIFRTYERRVQDRVQWIMAQLETEIDLSSQDTYNTDRSEASWPADPAAADDLWNRRLKFELLQEVLNDKPIDEAKASVRKRYERMLKNLADIESTDLSELYLSNIAKLYDPHSTYFSHDTYEDFGIQMRLQLVGIGALLGLEEDYCVVKEVIAGGPADLDTRLKPNDKIIAVAQDDGEPVEVIGMKLRKIVDLIRGEKGTRVRLVVQPAAAPDPSVRTEIVLNRDLVNLDSARAHAAIFEVPDQEGNIAPIGVITLPAFYGADSSADGEPHTASRDVAELIRRLKAAGVQGMVLDLRDNGGGLLSEAIELTGLFIQSGPVVQVRTYFGDVKVDSDEDDEVAYTGPLAVLVSRFSASASEIVAGALQNYGRAVVIGDSSTHGKGTVQTVVEMRNLLARQMPRTQIEQSGAAKFTIQKFYLPSGASTQQRGVVPDIVLPSIEDQISKGERELPRALVWDEIPSSFFEGTPLDQKVIEPLRQASLERQSELEEFAFLQENINWFKQRQEERTVSLNLEERERQKAADKEFRERMDNERKRLAESNFKFTEVLLAPRPPRNKRAEPDPDEAALDGELPAEDEPEGYARLDIHLREAMRVIMDAVEIGRDPQMWVADHAPLTVQLAKKG